MTPPIIEKKRALLLAVCALATGVLPIACSDSDEPGTSGDVYDSGVLTPVEGNLFIPYDADVGGDADVNDGAIDADADISDASHDAD
jgi:hypothetical protein